MLISQQSTRFYDTAGLTCRLLQLLPDRHMVRMIMEMVGNRSFILVLEMAKGVGCNASRTAFPGICPGTPSLQHLHL